MALSPNGATCRLRRPSAINPRLLQFRLTAEAVPWRCHRSLIGDALLLRGIQVEDILSVKQSRPHALTPFAKVNGLEITYPAEGTLDLFSEAKK